MPRKDPGMPYDLAPMLKKRMAVGKKDVENLQ